MTNNKILDLKELLPVIKQMTPPDTSICVYEKTGKLVGIVRNKTIDVPFQEGQIVDFNIPQFDAVRECIRTGRSIHNVLPREAFGIAMEGDIIPVRDDGEVVGIVITFFSTELSEQIKGRTVALNDDIGNVNSAVRGIGNSAEELSHAINGIHTASCKVEKKIREINEITK